MNLQSKRKPAVAWIVLMMILFFPVGFWLLYRRLTADPAAILKKVSALRGYGWGFLIFGLLGVIVFLTSDMENRSFGTIFYCLVTVLGLWFLLKCSRYKKKAVFWGSCVDLVVNQRITSIHRIAEQTKAPEDYTALQLQRMIDLGYFGNAMIDRDQILLQTYRPVEPKSVLSGIIPVYPEAPPVRKAPAAEPPIQQDAKRVIICPSCGARNQVLLGSDAECEYCGSPLAAKK